MATRRTCHPPRPTVHIRRPANLFSRRLAHGVAALVLALSLPGCVTTEHVTVRVIDGRPQLSRYVPIEAYTHYLRAEIQRNRSNLTEAVVELRRAITVDPQSAYLHTELARTLAAAGKMRQAHKEVKRALALTADFPQALVIRAKLAFLRGDQQAGQRDLQRCIRQNPGYAPAYLTLARALEQQLNNVRARHVLSQLLARKPRHRDALLTLGALCLRIVDYRCAATAYTGALRIEVDLPTLLRLAHVHRGMGETSRTVDYLREAFDYSDGEAEIAAPLLAALRDAGNQQAANDLLDVLERETRNASGKNADEHLLVFGRLALAAGQPHRIVALSQLARPADLRFQLILAQALWEMGRRSNSERLLRAMVDSPLRTAATLALSELLRREQRHREAVQLLISARKRQPSSNKLALALANAQYLAGQPAAAVHLLHSHIKKYDRESAELVLGLGLALERAGRWREGVGKVRWLLKKRPDDPVALNFIGFANVDHSGDLGTAERALRQAMYHSPIEPSIVDSLGWLYFKQGRLAAAERVLRIAVKLSPKEAEVVGHLAQVQAKRSRITSALALFRRALRLSRDPRLTDWLRRRLEALSQHRIGKHQPPEES